LLAIIVSILETVFILLYVKKHKERSTYHVERMICAIEQKSTNLESTTKKKLEEHKRLW